MMMLGSLIVLALGGALAWQLLQGQRPRAPSREERTAEALRILEERYARGEIDRQEFEERQRALQGSP